jgi:protein SCO1
MRVTGRRHRMCTHRLLIKAVSGNKEKSVMNGRSIKLFLVGMLMLSFPLAICPQSASTNASQAQQPQKQEATYVCPMHPEVKSKEAGSCPKCGMTLKQMSSSEATTEQTRYGANYFPNFILTTQDGKQVRLYDDLLKDKIVAIDLIYTTCKYNCPVETALLAQVQKTLGDQVGKEIYFYSISIDPKHDTPEVLKAYADKFHVGPGWLFLTGKEDEIETISRKLGLYSAPDPANADGHTPTLLIGNVAAGEWMRLSALDNQRFLARKLNELIDNRQRPKQRELTGVAEAATLKIDKGEYLFSTRCAVCHTIGQGDKVGPDLLGVTSRRDLTWLRRYIAVPDKMLAENDPIAVSLFKKYQEVRMPNEGLHDMDVATLIEYISAKTTALRATDSAGKQSAAKQDEK